MNIPGSVNITRTRFAHSVYANVQQPPYSINSAHINRNTVEKVRILTQPDLTRLANWGEATIANRTNEISHIRGPNSVTRSAIAQQGCEHVQPRAVLERVPRHTDASTGDAAQKLPLNHIPSGIAAHTLSPFSASRHLPGAPDRVSSSLTQYPPGYTGVVRGLNSGNVHGTRYAMAREASSKLIRSPAEAREDRLPAAFNSPPKIYPTW